MENTDKIVEVLKSATIRFAGDSGDGMQLAGTRFTETTAQYGNDLSTLPDYPAEIRAPAGTLAGVSGFQIQFSSSDIFSPGDEPDVLVAMNPAALKVNLKDLKKGGIIVLNSDVFTDKNLELAGFKSNPITDGSLSAYRVYAIQITKQTNAALQDLGLTAKEMGRCKNFYALGVMYWLYERPLDTTMHWINSKFAKKPNIAEANVRAMTAGYNFGDTAELFTTRFIVEPAHLEKGTYRNINGNQATAIGILSASIKAGLQLYLGSYPITPASEILQELSGYKKFGVKTFQAEDEIAAICAAIGASFGGSLAITSTSGPGLSLKTEAMGLAVMLELPLVIVNVQRGGPSTGLPTKTEQADLLMSVFGRNGECPIPVVAAATPADCFYMTYEAARIALKYMTPVICLTDGFVANGAEPWKVPHLNELPELAVKFTTDPEGFKPYSRNELLSRPWAIPGTPGLEHRIGGLEKDHLTGNISYDSKNHEEMVKTRAAKIKGIENDIPLQVIDGDPEGELLVVGWGSTFGAIASAVENLRSKGIKVSSTHVRHLFPFPKNLGEVIRKFKKVLIPEMNLGQLALLIRAEYMIDVISYPKVQGQPFKASEIEAKIKEILGR